MSGRWSRHAATSLGVAAVALVSLGLAPAASAGAARGGIPAATKHTGSLVATGVCPYDYEDATGGQSYGEVTTKGTLTGFKANTTYYIYDDPGNPSANYDVAVKANSHGDIVINRDLGLTGPDGSPYGDYDFDWATSRHKTSTTDLQYWISTDPDAYEAPPDDLVYTPKTSLTANATCNPWLLSGGTELYNDPDYSMINGPSHDYAFGAGLAPNGDGNGNFGIYDGSKVVWSTGTTGTGSYLILKRDGNLVVYTSAKKIAWQSHTAGHPGDYLILKYNRNLVVYSRTGALLWQSHTAVS